MVLPPRTVVSNLAEARLNARLRSVRSATRGQSFLLQVGSCLRPCPRNSTWHCSCAGSATGVHQPRSDSLVCACKREDGQHSSKRALVPFVKVQTGTDRGCCRGACRGATP